MQTSHAASGTFSFEEIGRLPSPGDNVAIAGRRLPAGTVIVLEQRRFSLDYTLLEGHRFAVRPIETGESLLSWGLPFGVATRPIAAGSYVCNAAMIEALQGRSIDFEVPYTPNFQDQIQPFQLNAAEFQPGIQVSPHEQARYFMGYRRDGGRGTGSRNMIIILGTTSRAAGYTRMLERRMKGLAAVQPNLDGIAAISHTEGSGNEPLNNREMLLRTLAGLMVHPNCGAVLAVDAGADSISNQDLAQYMADHEYPLHAVRHQFLTLSGDFQADLDQGAAIIRRWLATAAVERTREPLSELNIGLQCGGSDAFSGISGNPLAAAVAREVVRYGGRANLAETDELIGAESYMLQNVRDLETAQTFLDFIARFKERLAWHGVTAEGNPSGGNRYRGLYNIVLKSIGAAMKRHPLVRLDYAHEYAQRMEQPGFYFMDSPGNDLESIAGQVAAGSNLMLFVTGNGSITNFPLVPTIKIMTTSGRFEHLSQEMDINAGAFQDGRPMEELASDALDLTVAVASGQRSAGERAGHAQVSIWRNWRQQDGRRLELQRTEMRPTGEPLVISNGTAAGEDVVLAQLPAAAARHVGLILPTSLCSGQIARMAAGRLNSKANDFQNISRFVSLSHTEGCAVGAGTGSGLFDRTMINYMCHPLVRHGLFLEHGCEHTHNDHMRRLLQQRGLDPARFGWASIQMDGGIERTLTRIESYFKGVDGTAVFAAEQSASSRHFSLGLLSDGPVPEAVAESLARLSRAIVLNGGTVVLPQHDGLLRTAVYQAGVLAAPAQTPTIAYGQAIQLPGLHIMEAPTRHWVETLTGLGAAGVQVMLAYISGTPQQAQPLVPLIQICVGGNGGPDFDLILDGDTTQWGEAVWQLLQQVVSNRCTPKLMGQGNVDFQITRGLLGISM